jgi:hypothetical protein
VAWTAAVRDGAERVASVMDCQTDLFGMFIDEMRGMRAAVDHLSASAASSLRAAASTVADEEEGDVAVDITMGEVGDKSGGDEEENDGGEGDNKEERSGASGTEWDTAPKASVSLQVAERPRVPCPQWRPWKDKGKGKM